ncbi:hypothetical protein AB1Y20_009916 [Prymnesium parvum]|uniref:Probable beta-glucosidase G n=1 Tax=Prymnesium parvum TaxID=97485 RepID=A0AB34K3H4_PRYPA
MRSLSSSLSSSRERRSLHERVPGCDMEISSRDQGGLADVDADTELADDAIKLSCREAAHTPDDEEAPTDGIDVSPGARFVNARDVRRAGAQVVPASTLRKASLRGRIGKAPPGTCSSRCLAALAALVGLVAGASFCVCLMFVYAAIAPYTRMRHTSKIHFLSYVSMAGIGAVVGLCSVSPMACCLRRCRWCCPASTRRTVSAAVALLLLAVALLLVPSRPQYTVMLFDMSAPHAAAQTSWANWTDVHMTAEARAAALVAQMTSEEKFRLVQGVGWRAWVRHHGVYHGTTLAVPRLGIPSIHMQDAGQGWATTDRRMLDKVTSWPSALAVAATWDADLVELWAIAIAREFKRKGANTLLGPGVDVSRVPRNGRTAESLAGEEPSLGAVLAYRYVKGLQSEGIAAVAKHFAGYVQETNRALVYDAVPAYSIDADERTLMEIYYAPIQAMIRAGLASVMCSYNKVNGVQACESLALLESDLRSKLGFEGFVVTDWWGGGRSGGQPASRGLDMNMPGTDRVFDEYFVRHDNDRSDDFYVDRMVTRVLRAMLRVGGLPGGALAGPKCIAPCDCERWLYDVNSTDATHQDLARELAIAGAVLLKNEGAVLPISRNATVALLGSACDAKTDIEAMLADYTVGDYYVVGGSGRVASRHPVSLLHGLKARGIRLILSLNEDMAAARNAMARADIAIACAGTTSAEASDRRSLELDQHDFLSALASYVKSGEAPSIPLVVVALAPGQLVVPWAYGAAAILTLFLSGAQTGHAAAELLLGNSNPSGRLPVTFYHDERNTTLPCQTPSCVHSERLKVGWRAFHNQNYGTAPVTFVTLTVEVLNTGARAGRDVAQCYLVFPESAGEPALVLRAFKRTPLLLPGSAATLVFDLSDLDFSIWKPEIGWSVPSGSFRITVGASSQDERLTHDISL